MRPKVRVEMATSIANRISRAVTKALQERDRAEMRAIDTLLSFAGPRRRERTRPAGRKRRTRSARRNG